MNVAVVVATVAAVALAGAARAEPIYVSSIPNGTRLQCIACHDRAAGGQGWNLFGEDILIEGGANPEANPNHENSGYNHQTPVWDDVCDLDSDGDGFTNGEELGDPDCVWARGDTNPDVTPSNPGLVDSTPDTVAGEGEGEGDDDGDLPPPGGCASTHAPLALALVVLLLGARVRRGPAPRAAGKT